MSDKKDVALERVIVQFLKHQSPYNKDEVAGFDKDHAEALIQAKVAKLYKQ
ncbi:hypothetical protein [Pleionea sediminis]|uniref:hypothetical protein n=1 Tax=Pleionea sediminis TaxID=2569479 RepID=UPI0013DE6FE3|nr:hypothetical protein [Pleionea sediminis]